jgi:hypothetical protein
VRQAEAALPIEEMVAAAVAAAAIEEFEFPRRSTNVPSEF